MRSIQEANLTSKRVIVRVDWNVELGKAMKVIDDTRIERTIPTLEWIIEREPEKVVLIAHLGRPDGRVVSELSLGPVVEYATKLLGRDIELSGSIEKVRSSSAGVVILENVRFFPGEKVNDPEFARNLASLGDIYVNEAFGEAHRVSASSVGIPGILPGYAGMDFMREVEVLGKIMRGPERPFVVIVGGAKVKDKMGVLDAMSHAADVILLGGKLANEFQKNNLNLSGKARVIVPIEGDDLLDIGEKTRDVFSGVIAKAKTVVWSGPMGMVEDERYKAGTHAVYEALTQNEPAMVVVGGGDTIAAIHEERHLERIDFVSTGGGAMLEYLEKGTLPAIEALR